MFVDVDDDTLKHDVILGDFELPRQLGEKAANDGLLFHADHGIHRPAHTDIGDIRRAARQNPFIRGLHMGVRAEDHRCAAVEIPAHGVFLRGRFGVHVDNNHRRMGALDFKNLIDSTERILDMIGHKDTPLKIDHQRAKAVAVARHTNPGRARPPGKLAGRIRVSS